jgi:large subunit ribosomal protein L18
LRFKKEEARKARHFRVRKKVSGTAEKPRLNVFRSVSIDKELKGKIKSGGNIEAAKTVGELIAKKTLDKGINQIVFDRGGYLYHGRIKALADAAREGGLKF